VCAMDDTVLLLCCNHAAAPPFDRSYTCHVLLCSAVCCFPTSAHSVCVPAAFLEVRWS
jgi:hypothetical protein